MDAVFLKRNKGRRLRAAPPIVRKFCCFQQEDLSGNLLHGEAFDNIACPVKPPVSREPFRSYQRGEMRFPRTEVLFHKTLVPADAGRRAAAQEGDESAVDSRGGFVIWESPPW